MIRFDREPLAFNAPSLYLQSISETRKFMDNDSVDALPQPISPEGFEEKSLETVREEAVQKAFAPHLPEPFLQELARLETPEEKLEHVVAFMQTALEGGNGQHFREFWEARKLCLDLFQLPINAVIRVRLWTRYNELCYEAKRVKELFEEQSSFVTEQIERAIEAVAKDFEEIEGKLAIMPQIEAFMACKTIGQHLDQYQRLQHELDYLNSFATRLSSLRKEVLKTDIKHKQKTKLLSRLWVLGDTIFPRRKQVIGEVSALFEKDVNDFIQSTFVGDLKMHDLFSVREEIQHLQGAAKFLTLRSEVFTATRLRLGQCWDSIKTVLAERKKEHNEQRQEFRHHRDELLAEIEKIKTDVEQKTMSSANAGKALHQIYTRMRTLSLAHQDVRIVREKLEEVEKGLERVEEKKAPVAESKRNRWKELATRATELAAGTDAMVLEEAFHKLHTESLEANLSKNERLELDQALCQVRETMERLHEESNLSGMSEEAIFGELSALERMRVDVREQLERWRRVSGGRGCDFSEALRYTELIEKERARLERIDGFVSKLEEVLSERHEAGAS